jgi:glycosyltransferase involved in cell wall biosynthesis
MKVLAANKFYFVKGGAERYFFELARILEARGHRVAPFAMRHEMNEKSEYDPYFVSNVGFDGSMGPARRLRMACHVLYSREASAAIGRLADDFKPDVAHLHNIAHQLSPSILYALRRRGVPVVQTLHDHKLICPNYQMFVHGEPCRRCRKWRYYNAVSNRCMHDSALWSALVCAEAYLHKLAGSYSRLVDLWIAPSESLRHRMIEHGVAADRIVHLPYAIAMEGFEPRYQSDGYAASVGRLSTGKGLMTVLEALKSAPGVRFKIAGSGPLEDALRRRVDELGLGNVEFTGYLKGRELSDLMRGALFVVMSSECYENSPLTVYEAAAYGKAVIGSRMGGIPELIDEGETGLIYEPGDHAALADRMNELWSEPAKAVDMGRRARTRAEAEYGPEAHYEKMMAIYERVMH